MPDLIEYRPGKGDVPTLCLTDAGADIVFTARIRADLGTWGEIAKAVGCSIPVVRRIAKEYFGDNPSVFGPRGKAKKRKRAPRPVQDAAPPMVQPAPVAPSLSPSDKLLMALRKHHPMTCIAERNSTCGEGRRGGEDGQPKKRARGAAQAGCPAPAERAAPAGGGPGPGGAGEAAGSGGGGCRGDGST